MSDTDLLSPHRFSIEEYHLLAEHGLRDDARGELVDGIIVD